MRIGFSSVYSQLQKYQQTTQEQLVTISKQLSSGKNIQFGYEESTVFNSTLRLDYEETTLEQGKSVSESAKKFSDNTDAIMSQFATSLDSFKTKMVHAANEIHSDESLSALADDLRALQDHFVSLANTSVGGSYIFSGNAVETRPIGDDGTYYGNDQEMNVLVGNQNELAYNITGEELFLGKDSDVNRKITTNIKHYNQSELHPEIMSELEKDSNPEEVFIEEGDTLRDLIGDTNDDTTDGELEYFYLRGRKGDGTVFKSKFSLDPRYPDESSATTVRDLLDKIGTEFGNTSTNQIVEVKLNEWGQIEVKDLQSGRSTIDLHLVSSNQDVDDLDELTENGARVTEYVKGNYYGLRTATQIQSVNNQYDHRFHEFSTTFKQDDNSFADMDTPLTEIYGPDTATITLGGTDSAGAAVGAISINTAGSTLKDLMEAVEANFGDVDAEYSQGKLTILDNTVTNEKSGLKEEPYDGISNFSITIATIDAGGNSIEGIQSDYDVEYDRVRFEKSGSKLESNVSQIIIEDSNYATNSTKLSEVAGGDLNGKSFTVDFKDITGHRYSGSIDLGAAGSTYTITDLETDPPTDYGPYEIYNPEDPWSPTTADEVTYKQLTDVMSIMMNFSNLETAGILPSAGATQPDEHYREALESSDNKVAVELDYRGRLVIQDKTNAYTQADFAIYDSSTDDFTITPPATEPDNQGPVLTFNASNTLVIDDPHVDFFDKIQEAIDAVENKIYRPDGYNMDEDYDYYTRNVGIQNAMEGLDHLMDHFNKLHAKNGSQGNALQYAVERNELMIVQVQSLRSSVIDTDIAETSMYFSQMTLNYQAMLSTVSQINSLSLVNYL